MTWRAKLWPAVAWEASRLWHGEPIMASNGLASPIVARGAMLWPISKPWPCDHFLVSMLKYRYYNQIQVEESPKEICYARMMLMKKSVGVRCVEGVLWSRLRSAIKIATVLFVGANLICPVMSCLGTCDFAIYMLQVDLLSLPVSWLVLVLPGHPFAPAMLSQVEGIIPPCYWWPG
ncbi:hypothetical protein E3N88_22457 [Mikania micrantha]|uniref:Uncharacterized protein n=1 Tax=Mikania micrantha TaxID=192012 RepID=A0A5N6NAF2_9ASTR|nr:hypothetical protein E3N88_22457 [Mikania micrantha]